MSPFWPILAAATAIGALLFLASLVGINRPASDSNHGFGPEWSCQKPVRGDPICVRR